MTSVARLCCLTCLSLALLIPGARLRAQEPLAAPEPAEPTDLATRVEEQDKRLDELKKALEDQNDVIDALREQQTSSRDTAPSSTPEILKPDFLEPLATAVNRTVNGRIHIDEWTFPNSSPDINVIENGDPSLDPENRLLYRRIRFGVRGDIPPHNMSYRVEIEFSGQDGSQFRDAWIGFDDRPLFNTIRIGNQKRPYGWDHLNSSNLMVFLERPFVVDGFNEDSRRFGIVAYDATDDERFNWQYGTYNLTEVQDVGSVVNDMLQVELAGRLGHTWWWESEGEEYAHWGLAGTVAFPDGDAPNDGRHNNEAQFRSRPEGRSSDFWLDTGRIAGADTYEILGIESVFNSGPFQVAGEFMNLWLQRSGQESVYLHGGYVYVSCFLTGEHIPWNRKLGILGRVQPHRNFIQYDRQEGCQSPGWGAWQAAVRLSRADFNSQDVLGGVGQNVTLGLNWYWNAHARMQFNYIFGRVDDRLVQSALNGSSVQSGNYQILGVRFAVDF